MNFNIQSQPERWVNLLTGLVNENESVSAISEGEGKIEVINGERQVNVQGVILNQRQIIDISNCILDNSSLHFETAHKMQKAFNILINHQNKKAASLKKNLSTFVARFSQWANNHPRLTTIFSIITFGLIGKIWKAGNIIHENFDRIKCILADLNNIHSKLNSYIKNNKDTNSETDRENRIYNPKLQTNNEIIIRTDSRDPKVPRAPELDNTFLTKLTSIEDQEAYRQSIIKLNPNLPLSALFTNKHWNVDFFDQKNEPVKIGVVEDPNLFTSKRNGVGLRFLDMPIYMPNQGWRIPPELEQFKEVILKSVNFERIANPNFEKDSYVYITVDQGEVEPHKAQRRTGWHGDSYLKIDTRHRKVDVACDHVYVVANNCPTPFLPGPFPFKEVDPENIDAVLAHFANIAKDQIPNYYPNYSILRLDPYCIHNVGFNNTDQSIFRTFVKISVSKSKYCKLGNARNPLFTYDWPMVPRYNVPYNKSAIQLSSHRKDRDRFIEINPRSIDFSQSTCHVLWAKPDIQTNLRIKEVFAEPAREGEILRTVNDGFLVTLFVAEKGDWKITASHQDQYFLSDENLHKFYDADPKRPSIYLPKAVKRRSVELTENVRFVASWGTLQYAQKGDRLMYVNDDDIYCVPKGLFEDDFITVAD